MANRRAVAIAGAVAAVVALLAIPVTRRLIGYALIALIVMAGCEVTVGSYTKRHCDAFTQAWETEDRSIGQDLLALTTPPEGETVEPAVHDAALALSFSLITEAPDVPERTALLLFECENVEG